MLDNHYWGVSDSFTRYRDAEFVDRGVVLREVDGKPDYFFGERAHPIIPGPAHVDPRPRPWRATTTSRGRAARNGSATSSPARIPPRTPSGSIMTPASPARTLKASKRPGCSRRRGSAWRARCSPTSRLRSRSFGRSTLLDPDWGFAYEDRIFAVPFLTLSNVERAVERARVVPGPWRAEYHDSQRPGLHARRVAIPGRSVLPSLGRGPGGRHRVTTHAGFEDGYPMSCRRLRGPGGLRRPPEGERRPDVAAVQSASLVAQLMKHRLIGDFATVLVAHKLFERFPRLRVAYIENGADWVPRCSTPCACWPVRTRACSVGPGRTVHRALLGCALRRGQRRRPGSAPAGRADPVRLGLAARGGPCAAARLFANVASFSLDDQRKIMVENARSLTFA